MTFLVSKGHGSCCCWISRSTSKLTGCYWRIDIVTFWKLLHFRDVGQSVFDSPQCWSQQRVKARWAGISTLMSESGVHAAAGWHPPSVHRYITYRSDWGARSQAVLLMKWLLRINRNASLKSEMEKRVFTIPITTFAPTLALIIAISFPLGANYKAFLCNPTHSHTNKTHTWPKQCIYFPTANQFGKTSIMRPLQMLPILRSCQQSSFFISSNGHTSFILWRFFLSTQTSQRHPITCGTKGFHRDDHH